MTLDPGQTLEKTRELSGDLGPRNPVDSVQVLERLVVRLTGDLDLDGVLVQLGGDICLTGYLDLNRALVEVTLGELRCRSRGSRRCRSW